MQPLQICIGPIIRIGRESWCLPYAGFFLPYNIVFLSFCIGPVLNTQDFYDKQLDIF